MKVLIITYYWPPAEGLPCSAEVREVPPGLRFGCRSCTPYLMEYPEHDPALEQRVPGNVTVIRRPSRGTLCMVQRPSRESQARKSIAPTSNKRQEVASPKNLFLDPATSSFPIHGGSGSSHPSPSSSDYLQRKKVDAIISTGPPHSMHLIARGVSRRGICLPGSPTSVIRGRPWITTKDLMLTSMADARHRELELAVLKEASSVVVVGRFYSTGVSKQRAPVVRVIANGFDTLILRLEPIAVDKTFAPFHTGSFFTRRNPGPWKAIGELKWEGHPAGNVQLKLVGRVDPPVLNSIEAFGLTGNLNLISRVPYNEVIRIMKAAPVLLLPIDVFDGSKWVLTGQVIRIPRSRSSHCLHWSAGLATQPAWWKRAGRGKAFDFGDVAGLKAHLITLHQQFVAGILRIEGSKVDQYSNTSPASWPTN